MRLAAVPAGTFQMGGSDPRGGFDWNKDEGRHTVPISRGFRIGVAPVTNAEFRRFDPTHRSGEYRGVDLDGEDQPVVRVSWQQAAAFCEWLSAQPAERRAGRRYRLPTEAEWEYAARAGTDTAFFWGDDFRADRCNFADRRAAGLRLVWADTGADDGYAATSPAGAYPANRRGLQDMAGNVWQ
jgi:formylglycine-generating enzyme required for sulfatase activity